MSSLEQSLQGRDLGHLKILADFWGIDFNPPDARVGLQRLIPTLLDEKLLNDVIEDLPEDARQAFSEICANDGKLPWALLTRRYGALREMGMVRRDRERPYQKSQASATEALWYRGLIGRSFLDSADGPEEFAYIPDEWIGWIPASFFQIESQPLGRLATQAEKANPIPATDWILDDACTALAGLRMGMDRDIINSHLICGKNGPGKLTVDPLMGLLVEAGLCDSGGNVRLEPVRRFLESSRAEALLELTRGWVRAKDFNELRLIPGLIVEGEWGNNPLATRQKILDYLSVIPGGLHPLRRGEPTPYCSLVAFIAAIQQKFPDFQRTGGEYDSWYLLDENSREYLRGYEHWEQVEGRLIRFFIECPLHWLGILDLATRQEDGEYSDSPATAFRFSGLAFDLLNIHPPDLPIEEKGRLIIKSDGRLIAPRSMPRSARYQIARFSEWTGYFQDAYHYQLTPASLKRAGEHGLSLQHLLNLMNKHAQATPPSLVKALLRWEQHGNEARLEQLVVLRVKNPEIIQALKKTNASRFLGEPLGTAAVIIQPGAWAKVLSALTELGYLAELDLSNSNDYKEK